MRIILHHNRKNVSGKPTPVVFEVYFSRTDRTILSTGVIIEKTYWDKKTGEVKHTHDDFIMMNAKIKALRERINQIGVTYLESGRTITGDLLKVELESTGPTTTLNEYISEQIKIDRSTIRQSTYIKLKSALNNLNAFQIITFQACDTNMLRLYHNHLLKTMQQTTTGKNHKIISKYLKRASQDGLIEQNPYLNFKIPAGNKRRTYLTQDELKMIQGKVIRIERLAVVRDMFVFMCNTGMEYADMVNLTSENITTINNKKYIVKSRMKVEGEIQAIPLFDEALAIIERYQSGTGLVFPHRSNQKLNAYLTELADICGIEKTLTTIVARHTFATLMLEKGMPLESVSHIMGHSNTKTTRIYAKMVVSKIANDLERLGIDKL